MTPNPELLPTCSLNQPQAAVARHKLFPPLLQPQVQQDQQRNQQQE